MEHHVGVDVSLALNSVCVLEVTGVFFRETKVASEPDALVSFLHELGLPIANIGLEAGPLSAWLYDGLKNAGHEVALLETRQVKAALSAMAVKTDRRDARGIAQLLRVGWYRTVHGVCCRRGQDRIIRFSAAFRPSVFPGEQDMGPTEGRDVRQKVG